MARIGVLLAGIALVLAGCAPAATETPTATPLVTASPAATPSPTPSPTPLDVATPFLAALHEARSARLATSGTFTVGGQIVDFTGTWTYAGSDTELSTTYSDGRTVYNVTKAGLGFTKQGNGPWLPDEGPPTNGDLWAAFQAISRLTATGTEQRDGEALHRLEIPAGTTLDLAHYGLASLANPTISVEFLAQEDGTPAYLIVTATGTTTVGDQVVPTTATIEWRFTQVGGSLVVNRPADVWQRFTSERFHYALAYPGEWDVVTTEKGFDLFISPGEPFAFAGRAKVPSGTTLNVVAKAEIENAKPQFKLDSNEAYTLDGRKARLLTFHGKVEGEKVVLYFVVSLKSSREYFVAWRAPAGNEAVDRATFEQMLSTYRFD
jgi:hypothetical protein